MTEDATPPTPLPPAAQSPYPAHPAPQEHKDDTPGTEVVVPTGAGIGLGPLGMTLIGGAVAAVGLAIAMPFLWRRKPKAPAAKPRAAPRKRAPAKKS